MTVEVGMYTRRYKR